MTLRDVIARVRRSMIATGRLPKTSADVLRTDAEAEAAGIIRHAEALDAFDMALLDVPDDVAEAIERLRPRVSA